MWVQNELLWHTLVEVAVAPRSLFQRQHRDIYGLRNSDLVVQNGHHQLTVVSKNRALPRTEGVGVCPAKSDPKAQHAVFRTSLAPKPTIESRPICEVILDNMKGVPPEEFAKLPKDGASEHDHYLYGHPKRNS
jgi:hypothetical protein